MSDCMYRIFIKLTLHDFSSYIFCLFYREVGQDIPAVSLLNRVSFLLHYCFVNKYLRRWQLTASIFSFSHVTTYSIACFLVYLFSIFPLLIFWLVYCRQSSEKVYHSILLIFITDLKSIISVSIGKLETWVFY